MRDYPIDYKAFVRDLQRRAAENDMTVKQIADTLRVGQTTVYNWLNFTTQMRGSDVIRAITVIFGGKYERRSY